MLAVGVALVGCGGGGGGAGGGGSAITAGVTIKAGADTSVAALTPASRAASTRAPVNLVAPLDNGAQVSVYNFQTGELIKTGTLTNGWCEIKDVPAGLSLAIVVVGKRGGKDYRLSTLVPVVAESGAEYVADPSTSIAAEAFAAQHFAKNKVFSQEDWAPVLNTALQFVQSHSTSDFSVGGGVFTSSGFGKSDSLNAGAAGISDVIAAVGTVNDKLARAKNTIALIGEAGIPLRAMLDPEPTDFQNVFTDQVISKYQALAQNMGKLLLPAVSEGEMVESGHPNQPDLNIAGLTSGHRYTVSGVDSQGRLVLQDAGSGTAGQITVKRSIPGEGDYTVVAEKSGSNYEITQTFSGDSQQQYTIKVPVSAFDSQGPGANPTLTGSASLKDKNFTTPVTLNVTLGAVGSDPDHYTSVTFNGTLQTPQVASTGTFRVNFATALPSGAASWQTHYDFPTEVSMTDSRIEVNVGSKKITIEGNATATTQFLKFDREVTPMPATVAFTGKYANTDTGLSFDGSITWNATWLVKNDSAHPETATAVLDGSLVKQNHPTYSLKISANKTATAVTADVTVVAGIVSLTGTVTGQVDQTTGDLTSSNATITSSTGVVLAIRQTGSGPASGDIKVDGEKVADISFLRNRVRIDFVGDGFEEYPL